MASDSIQLRNLVKIFVSVLTESAATTKQGKLWDALKISHGNLTKSEASTSECNAMMYDMIRDRLKSDGKINDSMSETEIDWIIFTDDVVFQSISLTHFLYKKSLASDFINWKDQESVKLLEFPRFIGFNVRSNKRSLLTWIELFTTLLDTETKKVRAESGKKKISYESSKFTQQCQSIIQTCDKWNNKVSFKQPEFQIDLAHCIFDQIFERDSRKSVTTFRTPSLEKIWANRLCHLSESQEGANLSNAAWNLLQLIYPFRSLHLAEIVRPYCSTPLTVDDEKYLVQRRLRYEEIKSSKCTEIPNTKAKTKRGIKARAAREAAKKKKRRKRQRRQKRRMCASIYTLFMEASVNLDYPKLTFTDVANHVFKSKLKRHTICPVSFKDWWNIDLLIQLIKGDSDVWPKDKPDDKEASFQFNKKLSFYTAGKNVPFTNEKDNVTCTVEAPVKGIILMSKEDTLAALRRLRNKLRRDPDYFRDLC